MMRLHRFLPGLLAVSTVIAASPASRAFGDAKGKLEEAIKAYDQGELKAASNLLSGIVRELKLAREDRARAWLYLGLSEAGRQQMATARRAFRAALQNEPSISVDRHRVPPSLVALFEEVRARVTGVLHVVAPKAKARLFVDGRPHGDTPAKVRVVVGNHRVRVVAVDGLADFESDAVAVPAGAVKRLVVSLRARTGTVLLRLTPPATQVFRGKRLLASGPIAKIALLPGEHELTLRYPLYPERTLTVQVRRGQTARLEVELTRVVKPWYKRGRVWGYISGGIAVALATTGLLLGKSARDAEGEIRSKDVSGQLTYDEWLPLSERADSRARMANVFFGLAGAAAITSVVLIVTGGGGDTVVSPPKRSWRITPTLGGASFAVKF